MPESEVIIPAKLETFTLSKVLGESCTNIIFTVEKDAPLILFCTILCPVVIKIVYGKQDVMLGKVVLNRPIQNEPSIIDIPITTPRYSSSFLSANSKISQLNSSKQKWYLQQVCCTLRGSFVERFSENV